MTTRMRTFAGVTALIVWVLAVPLLAQTPAKEAPVPSPPQPATSGSVAALNAPLPVQLQIVIARYQGAKRVSSLPYVVSLNGRPARDSPTRLRMNGSVPVANTVTTSDDGKTSSVSSFNYREIGTNIDVAAIPSVEGRFGFSVTVTDSSLYGDGDVKAVPVAPGAAMFRSFNVSSAVHLRDGEMAEFTAATDRLTGEVTRVEITLTVLK